MAEVIALIIVALGAITATLVIVGATQDITERGEDDESGTFH